MDKFDNCTLADTHILATALAFGNNLVFKYLCGEVTAYEVLIAVDFDLFGQFDTAHCYYGAFIVAIKYRGMFHFNFRNRADEFHPNYVSEKLNIPLADAEHLAKLFNGICAELARIKADSNPKMAMNENEREFR